jgi:glycosyltransferase involved in cell wall biosynthesis
LPRISVVIPTYNRQDLVIEALQSVLAQAFSDMEIIVVDDGSEDQTEEKLQLYRDHIVYVKQANQGVAAARNTGIRQAHGEWICFLDSDDLWLPEKLQVQLQFADRHPEYALIATEIQGMDATGQPVGARKADNYTIHNGRVAEHLLFGNWIQTSTVMVRRAALETTGVFDEDVGQFGEDWLLWMRVAAQFPIYFLPQPLVCYRFHAERLSTRQSKQQFRSLMLCIEKLSALPLFQQKPQLLRQHEYNICLGRVWHDCINGDYGDALAKLRRARRLRPFALAPWGLLVRVAADRLLRRLRPFSASDRAGLAIDAPPASPPPRKKWQPKASK